MQVPRATSSFLRSPALRSPITTPFRRWNSTEGQAEGQEKVKGQVIGIDLGMFLPPKQPFFLSVESESRTLGNLSLTLHTLGTTNSAVALMEGKSPKIIENTEGKL